MVQMDSESSEYDRLVQSYLRVCNRALSVNRERFPFKQILGAAARSETGRVIAVRIAEETPQVSYVMTMGKGAICAVPYSKCPKCVFDREWSVSRRYMEDVVGNPSAYIGNPAKIDWEWMYDVADGGALHRKVSGTVYKSLQGKSDEQAAQE